MNWIAFAGLFLVLAVIFTRILGDQIISADIRTVMLVIGFALMLLGTLWKVVLEMNDQESSDSTEGSKSSESSESSSD